jgi:hypothetical protein
MVWPLTSKPKTLVPNCVPVPPSLTHKSPSSPARFPDLDRRCRPTTPARLHQLPSRWPDIAPPTPSMRRCCHARLHSSLALFHPCTRFIPPLSRPYAIDPAPPKLDLSATMRHEGKLDNSASWAHGASRSRASSRLCGHSRWSNVGAFGMHACETTRGALSYSP